MVDKIEKDYISNASRTNAQIKTALEQLLDIVYETPGSIGTYSSTITIASDVAQVVDSWASFIVDGEGAAADDLKAITTAGTLRDGQEIEIRINDVNRPIKLKHNVVVPKKLSLLGGADYTIRSVNERMRFKYNLDSDTWYQVHPDFTEQLKVMLGTKPAAVIAIAGSAVTPSSAYVAVNHASANQNLDTIVRTNFPDNGRFILLTAADSAFTYTLRHNQGAAGRILTLDGASIVLAPGKFVLLEAVTSTTDCWKEVTRFGYQGAPIPSLTGHALHKLRCNAGETALELVPDTNGGMTVSNKSANFNVNGAVNTRFVVDCSAGPIVATYNVATAADYLTSNEFYRVGAFDLKIVAYSGGGEKIILDDGSVDDFTMSNNTNGSRRCRALEVAGGVHVS